MKYYFVLGIFLLTPFFSYASIDVSQSLDKTDSSDASLVAPYIGFQYTGPSGVVLNSLTLWLKSANDFANEFSNAVTLMNDCGTDSTFVTCSQWVATGTNPGPLNGTDLVNGQEVTFPLNPDYNANNTLTNGNYYKFRLDRSSSGSTVFVYGSASGTSPVGGFVNDSAFFPCASCEGVGDPYIYLTVDPDPNNYSTYGQSSLIWKINAPYSYQIFSNDATYVDFNFDYYAAGDQYDQVGYQLEIVETGWTGEALYDIVSTGEKNFSVLMSADQVGEYDWRPVLYNSASSTYKYFRNGVWHKFVIIDSDNLPTGFDGGYVGGSDAFFNFASVTAATTSYYYSATCLNWGPLCNKFPFSYAIGVYDMMIAFHQSSKATPDNVSYNIDTGYGSSTITLLDFSASSTLVQYMAPIKVASAFFLWFCFGLWVWFVIKRFA